MTAYAILALILIAAFCTFLTLAWAREKSRVQSERDERLRESLGSIEKFTGGKR